MTIKGDSIVAGNILQFFGAPKNATEFELSVKAGEVVTAKVTYYPDEPEAMGGTVTKCFELVPVTPRGDGMPISADERRLRRLLALRVAMPHAYMDDGEMQGQEHGISIDFMREPVADIEAKLLALNMARFHE